ncbi:hypothetical protein [Alteromonas sp. 14N.309.X.WAT.G.H12]|uniref:hypothetical protein n=1 Tax=Alteromonas sp. 14N.309.X.WAT.G.H12 TaxID=3120824 RepID=UPI002FD65D0A
MASPATLMASSLAEHFKREEDKVIAQKLFELNAYRKDIDTPDFRRVAKMIAEFALASPGESESQRDLELASLRLAGLASSSVTLLDEAQQKEVLNIFLPKAMGEGVDSSFYSEAITQLLLRYLNPEDSMPVLQKKVKEHLDVYLNRERISWLVERVEVGAVESPFEAIDNKEELGPLVAIKEKYQLAGPEPATKKPKDENVASLSRESIAEDKAAASLEERIYREAAKKKVDVELQLEALNRMNALFNKKENVSWAEKSVWNKLSSKVSKGVDRLILQDPVRTPKESLFSNTLVEFDPETMMTRKELIRFNVIGSFKATFPSAKVSEDVYAYAALKAMSKGIHYPLIKSTFTDPKESYNFVVNMTKSLVDAGYDVNDIRVSPHLRKVFEERIMPLFAQENSLEEAPEALANNPSVDASKLDRRGEGAVEPPSQKQTRFEQEEVDMLESIKASLREVNEHPLKISRGMNGEEQQNSFSDLSNDDILKIIQLVPLLSMPDEGWRDLVDGTGLAPESRRQVERTAEYIKRLVGTTIPDAEGRVRMDPNRNTKQFERLKELAPHLKIVMPEQYEILSKTIPALDNVTKEKVKQNNVAQTPSENANSEVDSTPAPPPEEQEKGAELPKEQVATRRNDEKMPEASEPAPKGDPVSPYSEAWVRRVAQVKDSGALSPEDIKKMVELDESEVTFFASTPPSKDEMDGVAFSSFRRHLHAVRDAVNPFQEAPNDMHVAIMKKLPEGYLASIVPPEGIQAMKLSSVYQERGEPAVVQEDGAQLDSKNEPSPPDPIEMTSPVSNDLEKYDVSINENIDSMDFTEEAPSAEGLADWTPPEPPEMESPPLPAAEDIPPPRKKEEYRPKRPRP